MRLVPSLLLAGLIAAFGIPNAALGQGGRKSSAEKKHPAVSGKRSLGDPALCQPEGGLTPLPEVPEASGIAASRRTPGILWINSDAHDPVIIATDQSGETKGHVRITGAKARNWEAIAVAPCSRGTCLFIGDLGDNTFERKEIVLYRLREPLPTDEESDSVQVFRAVYPHGAEDAEAMWVNSKEEVFIVTKGRDDTPVTVFRFPNTTRSGMVVRLEKVVTLESGVVKRSERITDASISPDGKWVVLRSNLRLFFYRTRDIESGRGGDVLEYDVSELREPQGEGVAFGPEGLVYLVSEGGQKGRPGTFARLRCTLPPPR